MTNSLRSTRDRSGHRVLFLLAVAAALLCAAQAGAAPGNYKAQRFDVIARAVNGGLDVTETITFEFQSGTFTKVWREIPLSRTDGITVAGTTVDGIAMTPGDGPGHYAVSRRNGKVRVDWQFAEVGPSVHRFVLRYLAAGVVYREGDADVVRWRALPQEHRYAIDASRIQFGPAAADVMRPESRRVGTLSANTSSEVTTIEASGIQSNGWIVAELHYPAGQLAAPEPEWRQRAAHASEAAPKWAFGGVAMLVAGLFFLVSIRREYAPPSDPSADVTTTEPPEPLPAALASVLTARGTASGYESAATLLDLADRGVLRVREIPRALGRSYELSQVPGAHDLQPHEMEALTIAFADHGDDVPLSKARGRLTRQARRFNAAVSADLADRGLIDPDRKAVRDRLTRTALTMIVGAVLAGVAVAPFIPRYQGWPFLLPLGLLVAGFAGLIMMATVSPLSDQGLAEAAEWRGFRRYLKAMASSREEHGAHVPSRWIVYAIGAGLGQAWSRYLKRHPEAAPRWFVAAGDDPGAAFAAFVGSHAAGAHGGAGAGGGAAAAGGGGSGAG
jgi:Predicted membrane protein (DUF2207) C-terminal domain/Predicted membrane protein (DUF2207) N-terminal domain